MKTVLIPVDFTTTSQNTIDFAVEWARRYEYERIILLKTFYESMFENIIVSAEYMNVNEDNLNVQRDEALQQLQELCNNLAAKVKPGIIVSYAVSESPLLRGIIDIINEEDPVLIMIGSDNINYSGDSIIAANVIDIARISPIPVLVVPAHSKYRPVKNVLLPYNFNMINNLDRLNTLRNSTLWGDPKLLVLNIGDSSKIRDANLKSNAEQKFQHLLQNFPYEIYFAEGRQLIESISSFVKEHPVELVLALPGKHSFLYTLTHQSISEAIYSNARQPVLILK